MSELRGPQKVSELLGELLMRRGYQGLRALAAVETAWSAAVGDLVAGHTRTSRLNRGTLEVLVDNGVLLQELTAFRKPALVQALQQALPEAGIHDIRFRLGPREEPHAVHHRKEGS